MACSLFRFFPALSLSPVALLLLFWLRLSCNECEQRMICWLARTPSLKFTGGRRRWDTVGDSPWDARTARRAPPAAPRFTGALSLRRWHTLLQPQLPSQSHSQLGLRLNSPARANSRTPLRLSLPASPDASVLSAYLHTLLGAMADPPGAASRVRVCLGCPSLPPGAWRAPAAQQHRQGAHCTAAQWRQRKRAASSAAAPAAAAAGPHSRLRPLPPANTASARPCPRPSSLCAGPECGGGADLTDYSVRWHVAGAGIMLAVSLLGSLLPVALHLSSSRPGVTTGIRLGTYFGFGTILATAFIHMLGPAAEALSSPCLPAAFRDAYSEWAFLFCLAAVLLMHLIDYSIKVRDEDGGVALAWLAGWAAGMLLPSARAARPASSRRSLCLPACLLLLAGPLPLPRSPAAAAAR